MSNVEFLPLPDNASPKAVLDRASQVSDEIKSVVLIARLDDGQLKVLFGGCDFYEASGLLTRGTHQFIAENAE